MEIQHQADTEVFITTHSIQHWKKRAKEREEWLYTEKVRKELKKVKLFGTHQVDQEIYPALVVLNQLGLQTEYSCAGVSVLDEPEDHSLYAYVTLIESENVVPFIHYLMEKMKHRIVVTYEPHRGRYDLSSFLIKHNRSFCLLLNHYTIGFKSIRSQNNINGNFQE